MPTPNWRRLNPEKARAIERKSRGKLHDDAVIALGGRCVCCDEDRLEFLTIDHIHNDGKTVRQANAFYRFYREVRDNPDKSRFQVLCFLCNWARFYYGSCPNRIHRGG